MHGNYLEYEGLGEDLGIRVISDLGTRTWGFKEVVPASRETLSLKTLNQLNPRP